MYRNIILYVFLILFSFSSILGNEMWEKEIPPSTYLESFVLSSEESSETTIILSYISLFSGLAMCSDPTNVEMTVVGIIALLGGGIVIVMDLLNDGPRTTVFKEFKKIKSLENNNEKEKLSYELLVFLAKESRKKNIPFTDIATRLQLPCFFKVLYHVQSGPIFNRTPRI